MKYYIAPIGTSIHKQLVEVSTKNLWYNVVVVVSSGSIALFPGFPMQHPVFDHALAVSKNGGGKVLSISPRE